MSTQLSRFDDDDDYVDDDEEGHHAHGTITGLNDRGSDSLGGGCYVAISSSVSALLSHGC